MWRTLGYILVLFFILNNGLEIVAQNENQCQSSTCQNGGTCVNGVNDYTCQCAQKTATVSDNDGNRTYVTGFNGSNCEYDIDECLFPICMNGGMCRNEIGSYSCLCSRDRDGYFYSGLHCEKVTTYCELSADVFDDLPACKNNGTCEPQPTGYLCHCQPGFTGKRCRMNIDECGSNPCKNNSTCYDGINGYICSCSYGTTGKNCEMDICSPNPCLNGGVCHVGNSSGYVCDCTATGFIGKHCEILVVSDDKNEAVQHDMFWCLMILNTIAMSLMGL